ncbi:MAG TPA: DUF2911 domain-containing protein [Thermoanaerobaculia bacterium]|nr:DUF2911 domain-containing protein [Thermoanaerobaculia bacterium]
MQKTIIIVATLLIAAAASAQQLNLPRVSPKGTLTQTVGTTDITIKYNRPGVKGRTIWGGLVPYDQVWRTGANEATVIEFSDDVMINGQKLAKGAYSLHTVPGRDQWTVIFNKTSNQWGSYSYDQSQDALRINVKPERADFREWMQFEIPEMTTDTAKVVLRWENLAVPFTVDTQATSRALAAAEKAIASADQNAWLLPYRAADFAFSNNRMTEAQKWLDMSLAESETTANLWLKARMLNAQGKKADALRTAEMAIQKAGPDNQDFASEIRRQSQAWK